MNAPQRGHVPQRGCLVPALCTLVLGSWTAATAHSCHLRKASGRPSLIRSEEILPNQLSNWNLTMFTNPKLCFNLNDHQTDEQDQPFPWCIHKMSDIDANALGRDKGIQQVEQHTRRYEMTVGRLGLNGTFSPNQHTGNLSNFSPKSSRIPTPFCGRATPRSLMLFSIRWLSEAELLTSWTLKLKLDGWLCRIFSLKYFVWEIEREGIKGTSLRCLN